jgi:hypothetical protein
VLLPNGKTKVLNIMCIKKFFFNQQMKVKQFLTKVTSISKMNQSLHSLLPELWKKLLEQQKATNLAISVLCDLTKTHCLMCDWEQECADNPLLFNPDFACQF